MTPSPKNRQAPTMPVRVRVLRTREPTETRCAKAISARMPPSPRLSASRMSRTYFTVTTSTSDQKIKDRIPMISRLVTSPALKCCRLALNA